MPSIDGLWKINEGQTQIASAENTLLQHPLTSANRELALSNIQNAWTQINEGFEQGLNTPINNPEEKQLDTQFRQNWDAWKRAHESYLDRERQFYQLGIPNPEQKRLKLLLERQNNSPEMERVNEAIAARSEMLEANRQKQPLFRQATTSLLALLQNNQEFATQIQQGSIRTTQQVQSIAIFVLATMPLLVSVLAWMLSRRISQPIDRQFNTLIKDLELARDTLEEKVKERTQELQESLHRLTQTQSQLVQAEKMSSLGLLVAGVAHEINNPVSFIYSNLTHLQEYTHNLLDMMQLYQKYYPNPSAEIQAEAQEIDLEFVQEDLPKILDSMQLGTDRIQKIVLSLRNFSRLDEAQFKAVDIHEGIDSTLLILQYRIKANSERPQIEIVKEYGQLPLVECYPGQLNQVVMNILANAIDALEESNVERTFEDIQEDSNQIVICTSPINEDWVQIAITDNGSGMSEQVKQEIFNPFFTTKPIGKGTGMGMSISYQIITEKHKGKLECLSTVGQGTKFVIQLPIQQ
ncbi:hypothetical protein BI308_14660 [Roseofilum reptotaenium AO1-A]|uniref:histidine kinase n=1 Tax=Roseofilum reptotaenium AO1-A TaxID=1925591 RepID=A0A1L9QQE1_9CYAN|nr:ATP-binding protein [Roseofilum reptotaenium]OJJ24807.1 hypothetical protein BI308_14660 [Roseofilum reptotaenium AO1-A]